MGRRRAVVLAGVLLAVAALAAGCGLPTDDEPQELSADAVPFDLLAGPTTTVATRPGPTTELVNLYFRDTERLVAVPEEVGATGGTAPEPNEVIQALLDTTGEELDPGVRSAIPPGTVLRGTRQTGGVLTIDLSDQFTTVEGTLLIFAVAQLVYTATELPGVNRVRFAIDGERISVPDDEGVEQEDPVTPSDYLAIAPLPS